MATPGESPTTSVHAPDPAGEPSSILLIMSRRVDRADIEALCERLSARLVAGDADLVVCDTRALVDPDAVAVDAVARLQLTARRLGRCVTLRNVSLELQELLAFVGLCDVVPVCKALALQPSGKAKEGKQARGVEEKTDPGDTSV